MVQGFLSVLSDVKYTLKADAGRFCAVVQHQRHLSFIVPKIVWRWWSPQGVDLMRSYILRTCVAAQIHL